MPGLPPLNALRAFEAAARHLSFKKAADELNVTPAAVSQHIQQLEELLGFKLFRRLHRGLALTNAACLCLPKLREGFDCLRQAVDALHRHKRAETLTVSAPPSFAMRWLMPRMHRFMMEVPGIDVQVSTRMHSFGHPWLSHESEADSVRAWADEVDLVFVMGSGRYGDLEVRKLLSLDITPLCSPRLLKDGPPLAAPADLARYPLLHDERGVLHEGRSFWQTWGAAAGAPEGLLDGGRRFSHSLFALDAAAEGLGVVASTPALAQADLESGRLVAPFALRVPIDSSYYLACNDLSWRKDNLRVFCDWLVREAGARAE